MAPLLIWVFYQRAIKPDIWLIQLCVQGFQQGPLWRPIAIVMGVLGWIILGALLMLRLNIAVGLLFLALGNSIVLAAYLDSIRAARSEANEEEFEMRMDFYVARRLERENMLD